MKRTLKNISKFLNANLDLDTEVDEKDHLLTDGLFTIHHEKGKRLGLSFSLIADAVFIAQVTQTLNYHFGPFEIYEPFYFSLVTEEIYFGEEASDAFKNDLANDILENEKQKDIEHQMIKEALKKNLPLN